MELDPHPHLKCILVCSYYDEIRALGSKVLHESLFIVPTRVVQERCPIMEREF